MGKYQFLCYRPTISWIIPPLTATSTTEPITARPHSIRPMCSHFVFNVTPKERTLIIPTQADLVCIGNFSTLLEFLGWRGRVLNKWSFCGGCYQVGVWNSIRMGAYQFLFYALTFCLRSLNLGNACPEISGAFGYMSPRDLTSR